MGENNGMRLKIGVLPLFLAGAVSGLINGYLGSGGGILLMFVYMYIAKSSGADGRDCFAETVITVLPMTIVSAIIYERTGNADLSEVGRYIAPALIGGLIGGILTDKISTKILKLIFAVIMIWSGINMFMK